MRRRFLPVLLVAATLILATGALVHGQESKAQPSTPQALRAREAKCEARLQAIYRQRGEVVGKVYPSQGGGLAATRDGSAGRAYLSDPDGRGPGDGADLA